MIKLYLVQNFGWFAISIRNCDYWYVSTHDFSTWR